MYFIFILNVKEYLETYSGSLTTLIYLSIQIFTEHPVDTSLLARWYKFIGEQDTIKKKTTATTV